MESHIKHCIISSCTAGGWYGKGIQRLHNSLIHHGYNGTVLTWIDTWANDNYDKSCGYNVKAAAFEEAIKMGFTHILWCDSSVWVVKDPNPMFDLINQEGHFAWRSGYNVAQTGSDRVLAYHNINRDEAELMQDCASNILGVNINNPTSKEFIERWIQSAKDNMWNGSRLHANQSQDPRFYFDRNDQVNASILLHKLGMKLYDPAIHAIYYQEQIPESVTFTLRGM